MKNTQQLSKEEGYHLIKLFKQKFISPYKLIYMIDQKQADYFKSRNLPQSSQGCSQKHNHQQNKKPACSCSMLSTMLIPYNQQTKIEKVVTDTIINLPNYLNELLQFCEDRFQNIVASGAKDNLKVTKEVEKFIMEKVISESVHTILYQKVSAKIKESADSINTEIGLWATPATWWAKYPNIQLTLFKGQKLQQLNQEGYTLLNFKDKNSLHEHDDLGRSLSHDELFQQLVLLQKDGKFEEVLFMQKFQKALVKNLSNPESYAYVQDGKYFPQLKNILMIYQSLPFEFNMKMNAFMTINDQNQVTYIQNKQQSDMGQQDQKKLWKAISGQGIEKYSCFSPIGFDLSLGLFRKKCKDQNQHIKNIQVRSGSLFISNSEIIEIQVRSKNLSGFIMHTKLYTATKH